MGATFGTIDEYLESVTSPEALASLRRIREIVHEEFPAAEEVISYAMPAFRYRKRILVYFAAFKDHTSIFGMPQAEFREELKDYKTSKGTIQFPLGKPIPEDLIRRLLRASAESIINR